MTNELSPKFGNYPGALKALNDRFAQGVETALPHWPLLADYIEMPAEGLGDPVALAVLRIRLSTRKKSLVAGLAEAANSIQKSQGNQVWVNRQCAQADLGLDLLVLAFVGNAQARYPFLLEDVGGQQLSHF